jgi:stage II sporulation protein R
MTKFHSHSYRFPYRSSYGFIVFALILLIMSWEAGKMDTAVASGSIPQEAIRLRILANSDRPADQAVKRVVRDEIVKAMQGWATGPQTIEEARSTIIEHMAEIERITAEVLSSRGFDYGSSAELGIVPFPTKMYGSQIYPAGDYEAVRITLGAGAGENWWCVLFPPLCFIDAVSGEASAAELDVDGKETGTTLADASSKTGADMPKLAKAEPVAATDNGAPEAKFFIWELIQSIIDFFKSLFS